MRQALSGSEEHYLHEEAPSHKRTKHQYGLEFGDPEADGVRRLNKGLRLQSPVFPHKPGSVSKIMCINELEE